MTEYTKSVSATSDHLHRVSKSGIEQAIAELIWNALDADANNIYINTTNNAFGVNTITIKDDGSGITKEKAEIAFSYIGNSWKKHKNKTEKGRILHGKKGEGRFKAFSLGKSVNWKTIYKDGNDFLLFSISSSIDSLNETTFLEPQKTTKKNTGTSVLIEELVDNVAGANIESLTQKLIPIFASYLYSYPEISIFIEGQKIDPKDEIELITELPLSCFEQENNHKIKLIEWKHIKDKEVFFCNQNGAVLDNYDSQKKIRSLGYYFTAYLCSDFIDDFDRKGDLGILGVDNKGNILINEAIDVLNNYFKEKKHAEELARIERWKEEGIYPYSNEYTSSIEAVEKDLFDIVATSVEDRLPKFKQYDTVSKKFTFKLLSQALKENPKSIRKILTEVLSLNTKEQEDLAKLLEKTTLSSIIKSAKIVADRLDFLLGLEELVFDKENKKTLLERDQLHKILEQESWVFGEEFNLTGSEQGLKKVLDKHLSHLGDREDILDDGDVTVDGKKKRVDLMMDRAVEVRPGEFDYLVVELKRPKQIMNKDVVGQIESYAFAVSTDERFDKSKCNWTFMAVTNQFDSFAEKKANSSDSPRGQIHSEHNLKIIIKTWGEIINTARARLNFYKEQLQYMADDETMRDYLSDKHKEYLPTSFN